MRKGWLVMSIMLGSVSLINAHQAVNNDHLYCIILAGGSGERLWPLSRQEKPKQFLTLDQQKTFMDQAIDRVSSLISHDNIWITTTQQYATMTHRAVGNRVGRILAEPGSRNTGPALLLSCLELYAVDPDAIVAFIPADSFIPLRDTAKFTGFLDHAFDFAAHYDRITLLGVKPTYPATGYGYIEFEQPYNNEPPYNVKKFHEKPTRTAAEAYCATNTMLWNIGIFCAKVSVFIDEYAKRAPEMTAEVLAYREGRKEYDEIISDSVDYAVMEKSNRISVLPVDFAWCDVGNLEIFLSLQKQFGLLNDEEQSRHISVNAHNNLVHVPNQLVALIGVDDLCIVQTDDVLLIAKRDATEQVKVVVKQLKNGAQKSYL